MFADSGIAALRASENRFHLLVDSIEDYAIYMLDPLGRVVTWNRGAELNKGYSAREVLGRDFKMFFVPEDIAADVPAHELEEAGKTGRFSGEGWRLRKNGERIWVSFVLTAIRDESGKLNGFAKVARDLTDVKRRQDAMAALELTLREERDCLYNAAECSMDALYICEPIASKTGEIVDFVFTYLNSNVETMTKLPRNLLLGSTMCDLFPVHRKNGLFEWYRQVALTGEAFSTEMQAEENQPNSPWLRVQAIRRGAGIAITISDITERKRSEKQIIHAAQHDHLTGLPNRSLLRDRIGQAMERAKRFGGKVAVFLVDVDCFKRINDTFGHAAGDQVLVSIAVRLKAAVRATDSVVRIGGDEFVVVMPDIDGQQHIQACAQKILQSMQSPIDFSEYSISATCSIGFATYPDSAQSIEDLLNCADKAMYGAKRSGKNRASMDEALPPRNNPAVRQ